MTNSDRLQEIRERAEKATPGPWVETLSDSGGIGLDIARVHPRRIYKAGYYGPLNEPAHDAEFIAASREDIPWLLQLATEQQNEISWLRTWIFRLHDPEVAAQKIHQLTEEPMTIDQIRTYLGIKP